MSYWSSKATDIQSYAQGVNYGALIQDTLKLENKKFERLNISSTQENFLQKQEESLQKDAENSFLASVESSKKEQSQIAINDEAMQALAANIEDKVQNFAQILKEERQKELEIHTKENILQNVENAGLVKTEDKKGGILDRVIVQTSPKAPSDVSRENENVYNPLEVTTQALQEQKESFIDFIDEVSGKKINVPLSDENAQKLIEKFGSLEEARDYVKGFYYDAAYKMGYLSGDSDGDGKISLEEGVHLKSLVSLLDGNYYSIADKIGGGLEAQKKFLEQVGFIDNIGDFINHSITQDSNFDGAINLNEMMGDNGKAVLFKIGAEDDGNVEMFVIWKFNIGTTQNPLDVLLNLGATDETKVEVAGVKDAKHFMDTNYLNTLKKNQRESLLKTDVLLQNMIKSV